MGTTENCYTYVKNTLNIDSTIPNLGALHRNHRLLRVRLLVCYLGMLSGLAGTANLRLVSWWVKEKNKAQI